MQFAAKLPVLALQELLFCVIRPIWPENTVDGVCLDGRAPMSAASAFAAAHALRISGSATASGAAHDAARDRCGGGVALCGWVRVAARRASGLWVGGLVCRSGRDTLLGAAACQPRNSVPRVRASGTPCGVGARTTPPFGLRWRAWPGYGSGQAAVAQGRALAIGSAGPGPGRALGPAASCASTLYASTADGPGRALRVRQRRPR